MEGDLQKIEGPNFPLAFTSLSFLNYDVCGVYVYARVVCICVLGDRFVNELKPYFMLLRSLLLTFLYPSCSMFFYFVRIYS